MAPPTDTDVRVWLDPATRLPPGPEGTRARTFLIQRELPCLGPDDHVKGEREGTGEEDEVVPGTEARVDEEEEEEEREALERWHNAREKMLRSLVSRNGALRE
ncbi:hypothetical protein B9479_002729, partial [Cryptococcus floricola]